MTPHSRAQVAAILAARNKGPGPTFRAFDSSDKAVALRIANLVTYLGSIQQ